MITSDLRRALARAAAGAGFPPADPGLRRTGIPGQYAASAALPRGQEAARVLAGQLKEEPWITAVEVTGPGYLTVTVTPEALAAVAARVTAAGSGCTASDALRGRCVPAPPPADPLATPTWEKARTALAARLTARLAAAAGATVAELTNSERVRLAHSVPPSSGRPADAVAFAGRDAVTFTLARAVPGAPLKVDPESIARHVPANPAYAVRYAHARAAAELRWGGNALAHEPENAGSAARLLDTLSWLPERVAVAARRGRPDEFARYLEELARITLDVLCSPGNDRLVLAGAARTGLAAGLELLGVSAPARL